LSEEEMGESGLGHRLNYAGANKPNIGLTILSSMAMLILALNIVLLSGTVFSPHQSHSKRRR